MDPGELGCPELHRSRGSPAVVPLVLIRVNLLKLVLVGSAQQGMVERIHVVGYRAHFRGAFEVVVTA